MKKKFYVGKYYITGRRARLIITINYELLLLNLTSKNLERSFIHKKEILVGM